MSIRGYVRFLLVVAFVLAGGTIAANVGLDPEAVFHADASQRPNFSSRYLAYSRYRDGGRRADGVLFASSRGLVFETDVLARKLGVDSAANFSVFNGMLTDHLPTLEFLIRDQAARGGKLKSVLLMIDTDFFGRASWTNSNLDGFLPPEISGEHPARFYWRYMTVFQFRNWNRLVRKLWNDRWPPARSASMSHPALHPPLMAGFLPVLSAAPQPKLPPVAEAGAPRRYQVLVRSNLDEHLKLLARVVALCRSNGITLHVATSLLRHSYSVREYDPEEFEWVAARLGEVVPILEFGSPASLDKPELWDDHIHFSPELAGMILDRIYGGGDKPLPPDFGRWRGQ
jgi:hypothetical protein